MPGPHEVLSLLRQQSGTDQMATFAQALHMHPENQFRPVGLLAAAYLLGRVDALKAEMPECNGSAGPMAEAVLDAARVLQEVYPSPGNGLPF